MAIACNVCLNPFEAPLYDSGSKNSITTLCRFYPGSTKVFFCEHCGHLQTKELESIREYYADSYDLLLKSEEEDMLYKIVDGQSIFRMDYEVDVLMKKIDLLKRPRILDFGCGKGAVLRKITERLTQVEPYFFEVSDAYRDFWNKIAPADHGAVFTIPDSWKGTLDVVTSFFALEHISDVRGTLRQMNELLSEDGLLYFIVPDVAANWADMVVVDHVNHFTKTSLTTLLQQTGFEAIEIDWKSHDSSVIVTARKGPVLEKLPPPSLVEEIRKQSEEIRSYWKNVSEKVRKFESLHGADKAAIYGAGFYGTYVATCLQDLSNVVGFIDRDPHKHGKVLFERNILPPTEVNEDVSVIYVALNPKTAVQNIESISEWKDRDFNFFYL